MFFIIFMHSVHSYWIWIISAFISREFRLLCIGAILYINYFHVIHNKKRKEIIWISES